MIKPETARVAREERGAGASLAGGIAVAVGVLLLWLLLAGSLQRKGKPTPTDVLEH